MRCGVLRRVGLCWCVGIWLRQVAVCGGAYVVWRGVTCFVLVLGGFHGLRELSCCCVVLCLLVCLCCVACFFGAASCRGVRCCVLRSGWFGVGFCLVVLCGVVACLVVFRCGALPCGLLRCVVLLLLILVGFDGFSSCSVVLWQLLWPFSLLCGLIFACFVGMLVVRHCCVVWGRVIEAVPRTPWLGYGIQPVSGPLTPCTEGKTPIPCRKAPHRQPMHRQRRFVYQNIRNQQGFIFILFPSIFTLPF